MLPDHVFADVVDFLHRYDLDALLLTDALCSTLAQSAAASTRVFDFSEFRFSITASVVEVTNRPMWIRIQPSHTRLQFKHTGELIEFIREALRNCNLSSMSLDLLNVYDAQTADILQAIKEAAHTINIGDGGLQIDVRAFTTAQDVTDFIGSFRSVQAVGVADYDRPLRDGLLSRICDLGFGLSNADDFEGQDTLPGSKTGCGNP
ncbi:hypothetical protein AAVH_02228 [Aphelenchoides avenae]|nr:hypothetical protein AAVH_02228 [Aphelenchus avenae]